MGTGIFTSVRGFTYIAALVAIMIMGIMLGAAGQSWQTVMKREREEELLFRGLQIRDAIERWQSGKDAAQRRIVRPLSDLKDLLKDPNSLQALRYLRRPYKDPLTDKDWVVIKDPVKGIIGVASPSEEKPLKQGNFPDVIKEFEGKTKYSDWQFVYRPQLSPTTPGTPRPPQ